jgi:hypothetical protein
MEIEINHPPITCPACGYINKENAIAAAIVGGASVLINLDLMADQKNTTLFFCCKKCPQVSALKQHKFGDQVAWEIPS